MSPAQGTVARAVTPLSAALRADVEQLCALHASLCQPDDPLAGQFRTSPRAWNGYAFAAPTLIAASIDRRFALLERSQYCRGVAGPEFFDALAFHISELFAIAPFESGNRKLLQHHAAQLAIAAGHKVDCAAVGTSAWDDALGLAFIHHDHRALGCLLSGVTVAPALCPAPLIGIAGLPMLPTRDAPPQRRYLRTMARAKRALERNLFMAKQQATYEYQCLLDSDGDPHAIAIARSELAFLRSAQGPLFQADLLEACGYAQITPALNPGQSPLEIVREIAAAIIVGLNQQPAAMLTSLIAQPDMSSRPPGGSPHQDRLAAEFLSNTANENREDLRFASWQRFVDQAASRVRTLCGGEPEKIAAETKAMRLHAADRIRSGDMKATPQRRRSVRAVQ